MGTKSYTEKYKLTIEPGLYLVKGFGEVNLASLTLDKANTLYKAGFPHLVPKPVSKTVTKTPNTKKLKHS